jgi:tetratricopeptide (TPR) repeat protein
MDPREMEELVRRLVANPHDEQALAYAHEAGAADPKAYAVVLERVGNETRDPNYASHWLSEAANIWATTLGDAHRAARVLMQAIDRDPTQRVAADRLAELYREKGDVKALVALLERRAKALAPLANDSPEIRGELAAMHEELGRLWQESLQQPRKAIENYRRSIDLDPRQSAFSIYNAREIYKSQGQFDEAWQMYEAELSVEQDPARRIALLQDEAATRRTAGDLAGVTRALRRAREMDDRDPALAQEIASSIIERISARENVPAQERTMGAELLVELAEQYDGEHGLAYAGGALDIDPGHDRALQLFAYYARALGREDENLTARYLGYVGANPNGEMSGEARHLLAASYEGAGQFHEAIQMLEPLRALGDQNAAAKLQELYPQAGNRPPPQQQAQRPQGQTPAPPIGYDAPGLESASGRRAGSLPADRLQGVLDAAQMLANKGRKQEAFAKYKEVLESDPAHPEALSWVEDYLRTKRDYPQLRDVLLAAVRTMPADALESRKERLREVAGLCEGNLRDVDGAINAWKQLLAIDRTDEAARSALTRLLEKAQRWDDLANLLEQEATAETDVEKKISLEKKLAQMQETKRRDLGAAAEAWGRIANLTPEDERAIATASKMFEKVGELAKAALVIDENVESVTDPVAKGSLFERLGELRELSNDPAGAGEAFARAAEAQNSLKFWESAERCFVSAERWDRAADTADHRAQLVSDPKLQAQHVARAAEHLAKAGNDGEALARLEQATELDPANEDYAAQLVERYTQAATWDKLVELLSKRGDRLTDRAKRVAVRRQAATLYATQLADKELAREMWLKILDDGDDKEALEKLVDDAIERSDHTEATTLLRRLGNTTVDKSEKARVALREAELLADGVGDVDMAIVRYESILSDLDPTCRPALQAIADLQEARENPSGAADALERELKLVADSEERGQVAGRLARLYEGLDDSKNAIRALDIVRKSDPEDFDALTRLCDLCEKSEQWDRVAELLAQRIEVEADDEDASTMTRRLAEILADELDRGDEALAALTELADQGDANVRTAYIDLGDRLGWKGIVATKVVEWWFEARHGQERTTNLRGAFARFSEVGRDQDAVRVAVEIIRSKGADRELAEQLEGLAVKTGDQDALSIAHDLLAKEMQGGERATELVRQAEARVKAGAPRNEALQHGEAGLTSVPAGEAGPLLERLAELAQKPNDVIDLYERQVSRSKAPADRTRALARAAQVAGQRSQLDRARGFYELALGGSPTDDTLDVLEESAREGDEKFGGEKLRRALCAAMAAGGQGARDGGRTRGALLRRAASISHRDLNDLEQSFTWLGDALVAHVEAITLDALDALGREVNDLRRSEATITRALTEVFDGPLVRQLLGRRAKLRREDLDDKPGAAADLKKLHDLSPTDQAVMDDLSGLLTELGDYRGMVQLYEDQILRGKDMSARAELARKVARMWEEQLQDPREAADAWRRVLRMKQGDTEATAGLERAKTNMLKKPDPDASDAYAPPKLQQSTPPKALSEPPKAATTQQSIPAVPPVSEAPPAPQYDPPTLPPTQNSALQLEDPTGPADHDRASLFDEDEENGVPAGKPARPVGLSFAATHDEVTVSAPAELLEQVRARTGEHELAQEDDFAKTGEGAAVDYNEAAAAHAKIAHSTRVAPEESEAAAAAGEEDVDVIDADDLAEMVDVQDDEEGGPATEPPPAGEKSPSKRSPPPPIPRE